MFTFGGDDDFDFAEDFLQDAFEVNKKEQPKRSLVADEAKSVACNSLKNDNNCITKLRQIHEQRKEDLNDIESLLEDDWNLDDEFLESSIHEVEKVPPRSDENSTCKHDVISSTSIRKDSLKLPRTPTDSLCRRTLDAENQKIYVATPATHNAVHSNTTNSLNSVGGPKAENISTATNIRSVPRVQAKQILQTANGVSELGNKTCYSFNGEATDNEESPIISLPKRTRLVLGLEYDNSSSPRISPGYSSRAKRKFPGPAGILPQLPSDGKVPKTMSPVASRLNSPVADKDQYVPQSASSSQSSQYPLQGEAWQRMKKDFDIEDADPNSLLTRFNIAWVLIKARAKELPKKKAPVLIAVLKAIALEGRRAKVVFQDETGEIIGTIHEKVLEEYATFLQPGTVLVLRQVSIFSPTSCKHYLNVTPSNIVALYGANGTTIGVQDVSGPHLLAAAEESLLEATVNIMNSRKSHHANQANLSPLSSSSRPVVGEPSSCAKQFLFRPVTTTTEENTFWEEDDLDILLQGLDEKDLCG